MWSDLHIILHRKTERPDVASSTALSLLPLGNVSLPTKVKLNRLLKSHSSFQFQNKRLKKTVCLNGLCCGAYMKGVMKKII